MPPAPAGAGLDILPEGVLLALELDARGMAVSR
jgi:hypothetical protein